MQTRPSALRCWPGLMLALLLACLSSPALADWRGAMPDARLVGSGDFRWFGLRIYTARLWSPALPASFEKPFALELTYHRSIPRERLVQTSLHEMRRIGGRQADEATLARWAEELQRAFADVAPGQRITGEYLPGRGCRFYLNGQLRHEIADPALARAFFAIWLGPGTRSPELRRALLGLNTETSP